MTVLPRNQVMLGDGASRLAELPARSVDCVATSPPYFRLRDYQVAGQLGLEGHVDEWVSNLRAVLAEVARVLVPTGTVWLVLGDTFSTHEREGAGRKSLLLGPERLALTLLRDGWIIRNKIVWHKSNTVPTSVRDRLATKYEFVYVLSRASTYYFNLDAIRQPHLTQPRRRPRKTPRTRTPTPRPAHLGPSADGDAGLHALHAAGLPGHPLGKNPGDVWTLSVSNYRGGHFATFPEHLVERILRAGCPERRCATCRSPWLRVTERHGQVARLGELAPTCTSCSGGSEPGLVLDPFLGSGTTAVVAEALGHDWLGIELNPAFVTLAEERLAQARATRRRPEAA